MEKIRKIVSIKAPLNKVYDYVTTPENLLEIWPSMVEVTDVKRSADGAHSFNWVYKMGGIHFKGHADTIEVKQNSRIVVKSEKGIPSTFVWIFAGENGNTRVTLEVEYTMPGKLLDKLADKFLHRVNDREAELLLENLKARMEIGTKVVTKPDLRAHK